MTKKLKVATLCGVVVAISGLLISAFLAYKNTHVLKIGVDSIIETNFKVNKSLAPGEDVSFPFKIETNEDTIVEFKIQFVFKKKDKNYLFFSFEFDGVVYGNKEYSLFDVENKFTTHLSINASSNIGIFKFYIPEDVGNEAMNIDYDFKTMFEVRKVENI